MSDKVFHDVTQKGSIPFKDQNNNLLPTLALNEFSAREIQTFAEDLEKVTKTKELKKDTLQKEFSTQIKVALMTRLGIPLVRIAQRLNIHRETIAKYAQKNDELFNKIYQDFKAGSCIPDMAQKYFVPQALVWSVILQEKKDQERFKALNWGLRTWDHWYFNDVDHRFGDPWPGRIPAQLVAHTLFYFTQEMEDHSFTGLSPFNGKVYWKYGKQNAGKKNPGYCQKNIDHWKTKYPSQTDIVKHALNTKENFIKSVQRISHFWIFF